MLIVSGLKSNLKLIWTALGWGSKACLYNTGGETSTNQETENEMKPTAD